MKIPGIFTDRKEMLYFLMSVFLCAILFIFVYNPIVDMDSWGLPQPWSSKIYITLLVLIGFFLMVIFRFVLYQLHKRFHFNFSFYIYWVVGEVLSFTIVLSLVSFVITHGETPFLLILVRIFIDVIAVLIIPYLVVSLIFIIRERNREIVELSKKITFLSRKVSDLSTIPQESHASVQTPSATNEVLNFYDRSGRFVFSTHTNNVLYVESADNYCNIHYINDNHEDYYILHNSMKSVNEAYADKGLLRCHRCFMVNVDKVKFVKKVKDGLVLELSDTDKVVPVSKTYNDVVVKYFVK